MKNKIIIEKAFLRKNLLRRLNEAQAGSFDILLLLYAFSDDDKEVTVDLETLETGSGFSVTKVYNCILALEKLRFVERKNKELVGRVRTYLLLVKEFK